MVLLYFDNMAEYTVENLKTDLISAGWRLEGYKFFKGNYSILYATIPFTQVISWLKLFIGKYRFAATYPELKDEKNCNYNSIPINVMIEIVTGDMESIAVGISDYANNRILEAL